MEVQFRTSKLLKQYKDHREGERAYGVEVARKYIGRVNLIKAARNIEEIQRLPGLRCHALRGDRRGNGRSI